MVLSALVLSALTASELAPGALYDSKIPKLKQTLGHDPGEEITSPEGIAVYLQALAAAAPDRTRLVEYARTWEGRPLYVLFVASAERMQRLDTIQAGLKKLADPRGVSSAEVERLVAELPVVVWLLHGVHGNEISSADAALAEAYHLLAAQNDPTVDRIRKEALVLIDPMENPDGRARFLFQNLLGRAASPDAEPVSAEHDEPWPGGRSNHYLFDMNRDWFSQSQKETIGRTRLYLDWFPQVVVDLHEMGGDSSYYFAPPAHPVNPHVTQAQRGWFETFGKANAARFDERGFAYFIRETYDSFYPGYGESWPIFQGAIGMTYEQASARGLVFRRRDEATLRYGDGVLRHFTAALQTAATAATHRERLLRDFLEYRRSAIAEGSRGPVQEYLLPPGADPARTDRLAQLLTRQGIEVRRALEPVRAGTRTLPAGTYVVPAAQPAGRLLRTLLDPHTPMDDAFVKEQDRRRKRRLPDQIYDVTAWSLPLVFDVECVTADRPSAARTEPLAAAAATATALPAAKVGYLLAWGTGAAAASAEALASGLKARVAERGFTLGGRTYSAGTVLFRTSENEADLGTRLTAIAARHGVAPVAIDTAWVDDGISLGSNQVRALKSPRVLLAWDTPTSSLSAGWARFVLERRYGQAVSAVRVGSLRRVDLRRFDVVVLPSGDYTTGLGEEGAKRLKDWVRAGGTLVTLAEASRWAAKEKTALLETRGELRDGRPDTEPAEADKDKKKPEEPVKPFDYDKAIQPERERPEATSGSLVRVTLDGDHWLSAGSDGEIQAIVEGDRVFTPIKLDKGRNVGVYAAKDKLIASGLLWDEARDSLAQKAFLIHQPLGEGHVIAFAEDPNYRAFTAATELLFMNAVLFGPAY